MRTRSTLLIPLFVLSGTNAFAATLSVGPGKTYTAPCAAFAAAGDGDTIEIDGAGTYNGDVCAVAKNNLTIRGVNGRPKIDSQGAVFGEKAIWVVQGHDVTIDDVELTGATDSAKNGAGIRQEGANLTLRHSFLHDNEDGILTTDDANSTVTIENCEFSRNGAGDGQSHNLYINHVGHLVFRFNYSHDAKVGHLLKSRALNNLVAYNHFSDGQGDASYEVSMPNAGTSYVIGNVIEQSEAKSNSTMIDYASEANGLNPTSDLYVVNNTLINTRTNGALFVSVGALATANAQIMNNIFNGKGTVTQQAGALQATNFSGDPKFVDAANGNFHIMEGSPCENAGTTPPNAGAQSLVPVFSYVDPESEIGRVVAGSAIDIGAYEIGGDAPVPDGGTATSSSSSSSGGSSGGTSTSSSGSSAAPGSADGGTSPSGGSSDSGGCSCHTTASSPSSAAAAAFLALAYLLRRRRK